MDGIESWLAAGRDRFDFPPAPAGPAAPFGDAITLTLTNRDEVITFLLESGYRAREPDDPGSDVVYIELPNHTRQIVMPGETVTITDDELVVGRNGGARFRFPHGADNEGSDPE